MTDTDQRPAPGGLDVLHLPADMTDHLESRPETRAVVE